jgi:16S rRNA processing protein RimM
VPPITPDRVAVGRVAAAHGLRGEVLVEVLSDVPGRFAPGASLLLTVPGEGARPNSIAASRPHGGRQGSAGGELLLVALAGVADRTAAEALRGGLIEVPAADVPPAPDGAYYQFDLVGCQCTDVRGAELGEVVEVMAGGGGDLLRVVGGGRELLLPFVDAYLAEVDVAGRRIVWNLPEGLVEACGSAS